MPQSLVVLGAISFPGFSSPGSLDYDCSSSPYSWSVSLPCCFSFHGCAVSYEERALPRVEYGDIMTLGRVDRQLEVSGFTTHLSGFFPNNPLNAFLKL